jgi:hypothetical protein
MRSTSRIVASWLLRPRLAPWSCPGLVDT